MTQEQVGQRVVVVGNGMVGHRLVEELRQRDPAAQITVLSEETRPAYDRVSLSKAAVAHGQAAPDLALGSLEGYAALNVTWRAGRVDQIDRQERTVMLESGESLPYDALVLATGSSAFVPELVSGRAPGTFVYRTLDDVQAIMQWGAGAARGVVIGGGLLGLEAAAALRNIGLAVTVVEFAPRLMPAQLDEAGAALLQGSIEDLGIAVRTGAASREVLLDGAGQVRGLAFADGSELDTDLLVYSAGIRPRDELARACGLTVGERGGVVVDGRCATSDPHVYAVGECASLAGRVYGLVAPGYRMAEVLAGVLCGEDLSFVHEELSTRLKLLGVEVASFGDAFGVTPGSRVMTLNDNVRGTYHKLVLNESGDALLGGMLVGDAALYPQLARMTREGAAVVGHPASLLVPAGPARTEAPSAVVCSCEGVREGTLCAAVRAGAQTVGALKKATGAGTGCGGCVPQVTALLNTELERLGVAVDRSLCEHFAHTRQELFDLVRLGGYRTFAELLARHGRGEGCEVCKPAAASILASLHGEYVLQGELAALQDTNDAYLANIQKNGTYSVMPRVPGGEITAERLLALGEVARRYGLYCKITGGQRIDLLGARLEQLPGIWRELGAAGFESGHAYGKSLRTVKSCVGSVWCRYGVLDSTGLAVRLELRYRGLRSPHKLKAGVSGCTRECAEAQSKDFGVIATERGWNLYVGGNGGVSPRHATLLAEGLDEATLIRSIDRFLMFYIRTADRLQRTSTWLDRLPGGIHYLRGVVMDDRLGVGEELEAAMETHVAGYADEWAQTLADPERLRRFRPFVNSEAHDSGIEWVSERGQIRPPEMPDFGHLPELALSTGGELR